MQIHKAEPLARSSKSEELGEGGGKSATSDFIIKDTWAGYLQNKFHPKTVSFSNWGAALASSYRFVCIDFELSSDFLF